MAREDGRATGAWSPTWPGDADAPPRCAGRCASGCRSTWCRPPSWRSTALPLDPQRQGGPPGPAGAGAAGPRRRATWRRGRRSRSCSPASGPRCSASSGSARTTTSSSSAATRCWRRRWSRACASAFGVELPLRDLFEAPTLAGLARADRGGRGAAAAACAGPASRPGAAGGPAAALLRPGAPLVPRPARAGQPRLQHAGRGRLAGRLDVGGSRRRARRRRAPPRGAAHGLPASVDGAPRQHDPAVAPDRAAGARPRRAAGGASAAPRRSGWPRSTPATASTSPAARCSRGPAPPRARTATASSWRCTTSSATAGRSASWCARSATLYAALLAGTGRPRSPELPVQYADFAVWQREAGRGVADRPSSPGGSTGCAGELAPLELPTDRPRPAVQTYRGGQSSRGSSRRLRRPAGRLRPGARRDAVHDAARRDPGPAAPPQRPGRPPGRHAGRRPPRRGDRGADRLLRQHPGPAHRPRRRARLPRAGGAGAGGHARRLLAPGRALRGRPRQPARSSATSPGRRCSR